MHISMPHSSRALRVLVVHYGDPPTTQSALAALQASTRQPESVLVVDHAAEPFPEQDGVELIRPKGNAGYGAGINIGLGALLGHGVSENDIVVAMNNDAIVSPHALADLMEWWEAHPQPALAGPVGGAVNLLTGRSHIARQSDRAGNGPLRATLHTVPYLHGSFLAAPYAVWSKLKGFPEQPFLYWEDVLLAARAEACRVPLHVLSQVAVEHPRDALAQPSDDQLYYLVRNGARFLERATPLPWRPWWWVMNRLRYQYHAHQPRHRTVAAALRDTLANKVGRRHAR